MVARFELRGRLPLLTDALWVGERCRQALMKISGEAASVFSGRQEALALQGQRHAWYWPEDGDGDGLIDRVWVFAAAGFAPEEVQVLRSLRRVWHGRDFEIEMRLAGVEPLARVRSREVGLFGTSAVWRSRTPLVLPRHPKTVSVLDPVSGQRRRVPKLDPVTHRQIDGLEDQVIRLLGLLPPELGLNLEPVRVAGFGARRAGLRFDWSRFRRSRLSGQGRRSDERGYGVELVFPQPVAGPIALGYGAHFGLGVLGPANLPLDGADG
jgi:CRISPR-associated protein Csb2